MKKVVLSLSLALTIVPSVAPFASADNCSTPDPVDEVMRRSGLFVESVVESPLYVVHGTIAGAKGWVNRYDNVLLLGPGAVFGAIDGLSDAIESPINALKGEDSRFLQKKFDM